jgi:hypothetical protein
MVQNEKRRNLLSELIKKDTTYWIHALLLKQTLENYVTSSPLPPCTGGFELRAFYLLGRCSTT